MNRHPVTGSICAGNAGSGVWVDGQQIRSGPAGFPAWFGDRLIYQSAEGTLRSCDRFGANDVLVDPRGGAPVLAAAGQWAAFKNGLGTYTSWGLELPEAVPLGMAPDGSLFVTTYQNPREIRVYRPGTFLPALEIADANPMANIGITRGTLSALAFDQFVWQDQALKLRAFGFDGQALAHVDEGIYGPTALEPSPGNVLVSYYTQTGRLIVHEFGSAVNGYLLGTDGYGFTGGVTGSDQVEMVWAGNPGEIGALSLRPIDLTAEPPKPLAPATTPIAIPAVPPLNHRVSIAPFKDPLGMTACDSEVVVNGARRTVNRRAWVASDPASMLDFRHGFDHGIYTETFDADELRRVIALAASYGTRVAFCHDGTDIDRELVKLLRPFDQVWLECYRTKGKTLGQSQELWDANLDALLEVCDNEIGLIPMDYDMGGVGPDELWTVQEALDACAACVALANRSNRIVVIAPFEVLRGNGASAHSEFLVWIVRLNAATPGPAIFMAVTSPAPPVHPPHPDPILSPPLPAPTPQPTPEPIGGSVKLPAGNYAVSYPGDTLTFTPIAGGGGSTVPYPDYHNALAEVRAERVKRGQGPNDDIDGYRLLIGGSNNGVAYGPMDVDAVKAAI